MAYPAAVHSFDTTDTQRYQTERVEPISTAWAYRRTIPQEHQFRFAFGEWVDKMPNGPRKRMSVPHPKYNSRDRERMNLGREHKHCTGCGGKHTQRHVIRSQKKMLERSEGIPKSYQPNSHPLPELPQASVEEGQIEALRSSIEDLRQESSGVVNLNQILETNKVERGPMLSKSQATPSVRPSKYLVIPQRQERRSPYPDLHGRQQEPYDEGCGCTVS